MGTKQRKQAPTIQDLEAQGLTPWKPCGSTDGVKWLGDPQVLYGHVLGFFQIFVYHPDPRVHHVLTAWTLHTWHYQKFRTSPPLFLLGPVSSGKTTVLECFEELTYRGVRGGSMSNSVMFRLSDSWGPTFLVDESQVMNNPEYAEQQAFLNERYRRSGMVWRTEQTENGFMPQGFKSYGPTALAGSESSWEAMISRSVTVNMEKGKPEARTLTESFYESGRQLRAWLKVYADGFNPTFPKVPFAPETDTVPVDAVEHDSHFPEPDLSEFTDGRLVEKIEPLLLCTPAGEARDAILSFARDMAARQEANEDTSYLAEYLQAYLNSQRENGKVSAKEVRIQIAGLRGCDLRDKGLPVPRRVMSCLDTLGFQRTRMSDGSAGVLVNPDLESRLRARYHLPGMSSESSESSVFESLTRPQSEDTEDTEATGKGGRA